MKQMLQITIPEAKARIRELRKIVSEHSGVRAGQIKLRAALNNDFGIDGQDSWELLEACEKHYGLNREGFTRTDYFSNKEPPSDPMLQIFIKFPIALFGFVFIRPFSKRWWHTLRSRFSKTNFTFGDLVTWTFTKNFVPRNQVTIRFHKR